MKLPWRKRPWDKIMCSFVLQEYGADGGKGWSDITEPTGEPISKVEAQEMFKPDKHYRVIARALEGEQAGRFIGIVWQHYEPPKGIVKKEVVKEKPPPRPKDVEDIMDEWAERVERTLAPLEKVMDTMERIRERFAPQQQVAREAEGEGASYQIPPPEFDGKLPAIMHPYVVHVIAEEIKGVIDYGATRIEKIFGAGGLPTTAEAQPTEEEEVLPSLEKFKQKKRVEAEASTEAEEEALPAEAEEEELPTLPVAKEPEEKEPRKCANCGRTEVEVVLLPNGLCEECVSKLAEEEGKESLMEEVEREEEEREAEEALPSLRKKRGREKHE